jgi:hypothetical protein
MEHAQKPDFVFRRNGRDHLNRQGRQFSRLLAAEVCSSVVLMLDTPSSEVVWRVLATHSSRQFLLHFSSCVTVCHQVSTGLLTQKWMLNRAPASYFVVGVLTSSFLVCWDRSTRKIRLGRVASNVGLPLMPEHIFTKCCRPHFEELWFSKDRSQWPCGLRRRSTAARLLRWWLESRRGHGCLFVVSVVCCQVEVSATSSSLIQRSPTDCEVSCVI